VNDAIELLKKNKVDLFLSDYKMPLQDGLVLRSVMINEFPKVHFIMLTAFGDDPKIDQARKQNHFEVLNKPTRPDILVKRILSSIYGSQIYAETSKEFVNKMTADEKEEFSNLDEVSRSRNLQKFALNKKAKSKKLS
jgi:YesN/AraC family two-component response regulator